MEIWNLARNFQFYFSIIHSNSIQVRRNINAKYHALDRLLQIWADPAGSFSFFSERAIPLS